jgi:hypothetical protein
MITVPDANRLEGFKQIDLGNYYMKDNKKCLITNIEYATKYGKQIDVPIYVMKDNNNL